MTPPSQSPRPATPGWLEQHRHRVPYDSTYDPWINRAWSEVSTAPDPLVSDVSFNSHKHNDGSHVSPFDNGLVQVGLDGLQVRLAQGVDQQSFQRVLSSATRATTGLRVPTPGGSAPENDWEEMMKGGLQSALETQVIVFEVFGASRALTHQLVRSRKAGFHQQSQRATWYGDRPEVRMPESIWRAPHYVRSAWVDAVMASWNAYRIACDAGVSYQDARYILGEGTTNYIMCEYPVREFLAVYAYRGCTMFLWEMVGCMRLMRAALLEQSPWLEPYVKVSCEVGAHKCTFQGWENVEGQCDRPEAKQSNRTFLPAPKYRIGNQ